MNSYNDQFPGDYPSSSIRQTDSVQFPIASFPVTSSPMVSDSVSVPRVSRRTIFQNPGDPSTSSSEAPMLPHTSPASRRALLNEPSLLPSPSIPDFTKEPVRSWPSILDRTNLLDRTPAELLQTSSPTSISSNIRSTLLVHGATTSIDQNNVISACSIPVQSHVTISSEPLPILRRGLLDRSPSESLPSDLMVSVPPGLLDRVDSANPHSLCILDRTERRDTDDRTTQSRSRSRSVLCRSPSDPSNDHNNYSKPAPRRRGGRGRPQKMDNSDRRGKLSRPTCKKEQAGGKLVSLDRTPAEKEKYSKCRSTGDSSHKVADGKKASTELSGKSNKRMEESPRDPSTSGVGQTSSSEAVSASGHRIARGYRRLCVMVPKLTPFELKLCSNWRYCKFLALSPRVVLERLPADLVEAADGWPPRSVHGRGITIKAAEKEMPVGEKEVPVAETEVPMGEMKGTSVSIRGPSSAAKSTSVQAAAKEPRKKNVSQEHVKKLIPADQIKKEPSEDSASMKQGNQDNGSTMGSNPITEQTKTSNRIDNSTKKPTQDVESAKKLDQAQPREQVAKRRKIIRPVMEPESVPFLNIPGMPSAESLWSIKIKKKTNEDVSRNSLLKKRSVNESSATGSQAKAPRTCEKNERPVKMENPEEEYVSPLTRVFDPFKQTRGKRIHGCKDRSRKSPPMSSRSSRSVLLSLDTEILRSNSDDRNHNGRPWSPIPPVSSSWNNDSRAKDTSTTTHTRERRTLLRDAPLLPTPAAGPRTPPDALTASTATTSNRRGRPLLGEQPSLPHWTQDRPGQGQQRRSAENVPEKLAEPHQNPPLTNPDNTSVQNPSLTSLDNASVQNPPMTNPDNGFIQNLPVTNTDGPSFDPMVFLNRCSDYSSDDEARTAPPNGMAGTDWTKQNIETASFLSSLLAGENEEDAQPSSHEVEPMSASDRYCAMVAENLEREKRNEKRYAPMDGQAPSGDAAVDTSAKEIVDPNNEDELAKLALRLLEGMGEDGGTNVTLDVLPSCNGDTTGHGEDSADEVAYLRDIIRTLLDDPDSILQTDSDRRRQALELLPVLDDLQNVVRTQQNSLPSSVFEVIAQFVRDIVELSAAKTESSGLSTCNQEITTPASME